jgi:hypothetical protein
MVAASRMAASAERPKADGLVERTCHPASLDQAIAKKEM